MSELVRKFILGCISGVVVAVSLDLISSYLAITHSLARMVIAGVIGCLVFVGLDTLSTNKKRGITADKPQ